MTRAYLDDSALQLPIFFWVLVFCFDRSSRLCLECAGEGPLGVLHQKAYAFFAIDFEDVDNIQQSRPNRIAGCRVRVWCYLCIKLAHMQFGS